MTPRTALLVALATGGLAVAVVAVDLAYALEVRLDVREGGGWRTVTRAVDGAPAYPDHPRLVEQCVANDLRLVVHNDSPLPDEVRVNMDWTAHKGGIPTVSNRLLLETWSVAPFELRVREFRLPPEAFAGEPDRVDLLASVGRAFLSLCVAEGS